jgi:hypothetical protein
MDIPFTISKRRITGGWRADINVWSLTGSWHVPDKIYDGNTQLVEQLATNDTLRFTPTGEAPFPSNVSAPLAGDTVYIQGVNQTVNFQWHDVQRNPCNYEWIDSMQVYLQPQAYSGPDALNYLPPPNDTTNAAEVTFIPTNKKPNADIEVIIASATFSDQWVASDKPVTVMENNIMLAGVNSLYYDKSSITDSIPSSNSLTATIYPDTYIEKGNWSEYRKWLGYNDNNMENQGNNRYLYPPDSVHIHIRAHITQNINVSHLDSITVYDMQYTVNSGKTLAAKMFTLRGTATFLNNGDISGIDTARVVRTLPAERNWYVSSPMDSTQTPQIANETLLRNAEGVPVTCAGRVEWYSDTDYHRLLFHNHNGPPLSDYENPTQYDYPLENGRGYRSLRATPWSTVWLMCRPCRPSGYAWLEVRATRISPSIKRIAATATPTSPT